MLLLLNSLTEGGGEGPLGCISRLFYSSIPISIAKIAPNFMILARNTFFLLQFISNSPIKGSGGVYWEQFRGFTYLVQFLLLILTCVQECSIAVRFLLQIIICLPSFMFLAHKSQFYYSLLQNGPIGGRGWLHNIMQNTSNFRFLSSDCFCLLTIITSCQFVKEHSLTDQNNVISYPCGGPFVYNLSSDLVYMS